MARLAIALCTFNGERFLGEQLRSLAEQTRRPDELVVCDDASTDGTHAILEHFAREAPFPVRITVNPSNLGVAANFTQAIRLCTGDAILTCDQDDVWHADKLAVIERELERRPDAGLLFTDANRIDETGRKFGDTLWQALAVTTAELDGGLKTLCRRNIVTGATMVLRSEWRDFVLPVPAGWMHDAWIALLVSAVAPVAAIREPLIDYRQHASQQIGEKRLGLLDQYRRAKAMGAETFRAAAVRFAEARDRLAARHGVSVDSLALVEVKVRHCELRARLREPGTWRFPKVLREWWRGGYSRHARGWKAAMQDLFLP